MSPRNLVNLLLLVVIVILVLFVKYEPGVEEKPKKIISPLDKKTFNKINIKRLATKDVVLIKKDDRWFMQAPYQLPANSFKVEGLLDLPGTNYEASYPMKDLDVKKYGLDKPRATITFNDSDSFEFGTTESLKHRRYLRYKDTLYVTNDIFYHRLSLNETDYLDHALLPDIKTINKVVLPRFTMTLTDGKWDISPAPKSWSNDQANELIENWKFSQAIQISPYENSTSKQKIEIYADGADKPITFHIIKTEKDFYLARPDIGLKYELSNDKEKDLLELPPKVDATLPNNEATTTEK